MNFMDDYLDMLEEAVHGDVMTDAEAGFMSGYHLRKKLKKR